jgi:ubiquinone biosynthesis protein
MTALSWSVLVIGAALTLLLFAFVVRRLIGVRVPALRTLAAGIIAVLVFSPVVTAMIGGPGFPRKGSALPALWFVILGAVIALLAGMVFLVIAEALVPSGSVPRAGLRAAGRARADGPGGSLLADQQDPGAARAAPVCAGRAPVRAGHARGPGPAGPLGAAGHGGRRGHLRQARAGAVHPPGSSPGRVTAELSRLQDDAAGVPWPAIEQVLRPELGAEVGELFASFDPEPIAAASIAQVHAATLISGTRVVVKVRCPDVSQTVDRDLDITGGWRPG